MSENNLKSEYGFNSDYGDYGIENQETGQSSNTGKSRKMNLSDR